MKFVLVCVAVFLLITTSNVASDLIFYYITGGRNDT